MDTRIIQILTALSTFVVIGFNWYAATGAINNTSPKDISDKYATELTPASYAFIIWSLIYLGLVAFSFYQFLFDEKSAVTKVRIPYLVSCALNIGWIFSWHYDLIPLSMLCMTGILISLAIINTHLSSCKTTQEIVFARVPFALYFGWITAAFILNATITLVHLGVTLSPWSTVIAALLLVITATVIGVYLRFKLDSAIYPIPIAWALTAIGVEQSGDTLVVLATALGMMTLIFVSLWGYVKDR